MADDGEHLEAVRRLGWTFMEGVPHNKALGISIIELVEGSGKMRLPYQEKLIGNPETGVIHGGAISSLMDTCCGAAVFMKLEDLPRIATLDLRIDYLKPAAPPLDVIAHATCYKCTRNVAFVRCIAYHDDPDDPIASAAGAFALVRKLEATA
jgi:uncharacterized protein (TIGR00369 family)